MAPLMCFVLLSIVFSYDRCASRPPAPPRSSRSQYELRVKRYFPHVKDFERDDKGDIIFGSLKGPEKIEVRRGPARLILTS